MGEKQEKPPGYYSREARAQRSAAARARREQSAERRSREQQDRQAREAARERRLRPYRDYAATRRANLPPPRAPLAPPPPVEPAPPKRKRSKALAAKRSRREARKPQPVLVPESLREKWSHKQGAPETLEKASRVRQGALARLYEGGDIDADQLAWSQEIAQVAHQIECDVQVKTASFETRVDQSRSGRNWGDESYSRVIRHMAYSAWRLGLPQPHRRAILDMLILQPEPLPFSTAARRYRIGKPRAKKLLICALDAWPERLKAASKKLSPADLAAMQAGLT
jgi:hypothetical protein